MKLENLQDEIIKHRKEESFRLAIKDVLRDSEQSRIGIKKTIELIKKELLKFTDPLDENNDEYYEK